MIRSISFSCLLLFLSAAVLTVAIAGGEKLRYQMPKGTKATYTLITDNKMRQQVMGQDITVTSWNLFGVSLVGEEAGKNGQIVITAKVDTNLMKIDSPMMKDTARVTKEINDKRVRLVITPTGKTLKAELIDQIPQAQTNPMMRAMNPVDILKRLFVELSEKEVGNGDTWKKTTPDTTDTQGMKIITKPDVTFTIAGTEKSGGYDCLKITFEGTSSQYGTGSQQGMELVLDGTVKSKGTFYFAPKEGLMVSVEQANTSEMNISGTGEQMFTMTQSMTSTNKIILGK